MKTKQNPPFTISNIDEIAKLQVFCLELCLLNKKITRMIFAANFAVAVASLALIIHILYG